MRLNKVLLEKEKLENIIKSIKSSIEEQKRPVVEITNTTIN